jgi:hypothetical protein
MKLEDLEIWKGIAAASLCILFGLATAFAGWQLAKKKATKNIIQDRTESLDLALKEIDVYKGRVDTLEKNEVNYVAQIAALTTNVAELSGKVSTYEKLISGAEISPALKTLIVDREEVVLKAITDMDSAHTEHALSTNSLLDDIKTVLSDILSELKTGRDGTSTH